VVWSIRSTDIQTAFTVAGFILTAGTCKFCSCRGVYVRILIVLVMLALLAILSGIESSRALGARKAD
jgi:hypothetical protein